jgi:hypothetical protein
LQTAVRDLEFRTAVGATVLTWLISATPEAMPPVTDQNCLNQANDTAQLSGKMAIVILADAVYSGEIQ